MSRILFYSVTFCSLFFAASFAQADTLGCRTAEECEALSAPVTSPSSSDPQHELVHSPEPAMPVSAPIPEPRRPAESSAEKPHSATEQAQPASSVVPATHSQTSSPTPTTDYGAIEQALATCESNAQSTVSSCMTDRSGGVATFVDTADAMARSLSGATGAGTAAETCQKVAQTAGAANAALAGIKGNCVFSYNTCQTSCKAAEDEVRKIPAGERSAFQTRLNSMKRQCNSAQTRIAALDQNIAQAMAAYQRSQTCLSEALPSLAQCMANPNLPNCNMVLPQDCSNPTIAVSSLACICVAGSTDSRCAGFRPTGTTPNIGASGVDGSGGNTLGGGSADMASATNLGGGNLASADPFSLGEAGSRGGSGGQGSGTPPGGGGGGMSGGRGSANEAKVRQAPGRPESRINADVLRGSYSGNTPGGFGARPAGAGGAAPGGGTYTGNGAWIPPKVAPNPNAINFDKFRPANMRFDRSVASSEVLPSGLLAPHVNIWKKVNSRYLEIMSTLTP